MLKNIAHFSTGSTLSSFQENDDGSITKSALVFVEGDHTDNRGRSWSCPSDFVEQIVENTNKAFNDGKHIPILKEHNKNIDSEIGVVAAPLEARIITEEDLPDKRNKHLIGKLGVFCDGLVLKAKDVVDRVKQGLNRQLSPGIDMKNMVLREISAVAMPAITGVSMYSEYDDDKSLQGVYSLDEAEALAQTEDELKEEFMQLSCMFYKVVSNILQAPEEELGEEGQMMLEKAFADYELRIRGLFGVTPPEEDEDGDDYMETEPSPYSLQQTPYMEAPYSLYATNNAEFAFGSDWLKEQTRRVLGAQRFNNLGKSFSKAQRFGGSALDSARRGNWGAAGQKVGQYFMRPNSVGGGLNLKRAGLAAAGVGAAGYGAYRLGRAGLGMMGVGRPSPEEQRPWYRRNPFGG